jgi:hypothetical protein
LETSFEGIERVDEEVHSKCGEGAGL